MFWQECDKEESETFLISEIKSLDPKGYYDNILSDDGFVDLIYEITNRQWDWTIQELSESYSAQIKTSDSEFYSEHKYKYYSLASAYLDALYFYKDR